MPADGREILGAEVERARAADGRAAISAMRKNAAAVSTIAMQLRRAGRDAALGLELVDDLGEEPDVLGAFDLGQRQRLDAGPDRRLDVAHRHAQRPVDAHDDVGAAARHDLGRLRHQGARPLLLARRRRCPRGRG